MSERRPVKLDKPQFCKGCGLELYDDITSEWHKDLHGYSNVIPLDEVEIINSDSKDSSTKKGKKKEKKVIKKVKGRVQGFYVESIIVGDEAQFLCLDVVTKILSLRDKFEDEEKIIQPIEASECGYIPYRFTASDIQSVLTKEINKEAILDKIKEQIDKFLVIKDIDKHLVLSDLLLTYELERISTLHFPFFVGETESGKSSAVHLFRYLAYRCLYGEDIPNADIYNFLGIDEEGTGTIAEDESQELDRNREKIRTYKNSYSKGSLKARIIMTQNSKKQVFYKTFSPKIFAGEKIPNDKGFKERLAVVNMLEGKPSSNIKRISSEEFDELINIRNALLVYKIQNVRKPLPEFNSGLEQRDQELWEDFLNVVADTKYFEKCKETAKYYTTQRHEAIWNSLEAKIFKILIKILDQNLEVSLEKFWIYLTDNQDILTGSIDKQTFLPHEFGDKVTRNSLAGLFRDKFRGKRKTVNHKDNSGKIHRVTIYRFDLESVKVLSRKYNIKNGNSEQGLISSGTSGTSGQSEIKSDHVDHVDHSESPKQLEQIRKDLDPTKPYFRCKTHDAGVFHINESTVGSGNIHDFHYKLKCELEYLTEEQFQEYQKKIGGKEFV